MFKRAPKELYPVLPLRDVVVFPGTVPSLLVGREKSIRALEVAMAEGVRKVFLVTQVTPTDDDPETSKLYQLGVICTVINLLKLPDGTVKVLVKGETRARVKSYTVHADYSEAEVSVLDNINITSSESRRLGARVSSNSANI